MDPLFYLHTKNYENVKEYVGSDGNIYPAKVDYFKVVTTPSEYINTLIGSHVFCNNLHPYEFEIDSPTDSNYVYHIIIHNLSIVFKIIEKRSLIGKNIIIFYCMIMYEDIDGAMFERIENIYKNSNINIHIYGSCYIVKDHSLLFKYDNISIEIKHYEEYNIIYAIRLRISNGHKLYIDPNAIEACEPMWLYIPIIYYERKEMIANYASVMYGVLSSFECYPADSQTDTGDIYYEGSKCESNELKKEIGNAIRNYFRKTKRSIF